MGINNYIFVAAEANRITKLNRDVKALTICCGVLLMMCVKNYLDRYLRKRYYNRKIKSRKE